MIFYTKLHYNLRCVYRGDCISEQKKTRRKMFTSTADQLMNNEIESVHLT